VSLEVAIAIVLALVTAFLYALSNVLELTEAEQVPDEYALRVGLMTRLIRRPRWLLGLLADVFGYAAQAGALALAAVVFVEPILALAIVISLILGAMMTHRRLRPGDWISAVVLSGGLALFLYEVSPTGGREFVPTDRAVIAGPVVGVVIVGCIAFARPSRGAPRAALLGIAAGISFAAAAVLTKGVVHYLGDGIFAWIPHWESYALAAASIGGVIVGQSAFQTGALAASVGATESTAPIAAAILGLVLLDESVFFDSADQVAAVVISVIMVLWGIAALARAEERVVSDAASVQTAG
jgi:drug/metabolite transporter (DMT)-like permease